MSEFGKRSLRERRTPKQFDEEVLMVRLRQKTQTLTVTAAPLITKFVWSHLGCQDALPAAQLRRQITRQIH